MIKLPQDYIWLYPWAPITDESVVLEFGKILADLFTGEDIGLSLSQELQREVCSEHPLCGVKTKAVAFCKEDSNEVLFLTEMEAAPIVCVHLTWEVESSPDWPHFDSYKSLEDWDVQMRREHMAYQK